MSGLLGNIYSAGDRMKRKLGGLLSNPLENIALGSTRMAEDMNALSALASEAGYMPNTVNRSDQSVLATLQQKALARQMLADKGTEMGFAATFIGPSAKTWNAAKAAQAQKALDAGVPPEQVWAQTGTFRGADGKLRQEIDDSAALFNPRVVNGAKVETGLQNGSPVNLGPTVGGLLEHRPLQDAYGGVTGSTYIGNKNTMFGDGVQGAFDAADNRLTINAPASANDAKSTALHELQHAIQQREGFARGGNSNALAQEYGAARSRLHFLEREPEAIQANKAVDSLWNDVFNTGKLTEQQALVKEAELLKKFPALAEQRQLMDTLRNTSEDGIGAYKRLAGEAEARLTQSRMGMNPMQRAASFPPSMFAVPIEQQIVRFK
jgi:hypothetical protein